MTVDAQYRMNFTRHIYQTAPILAVSATGFPPDSISWRSGYAGVLLAKREEPCSHSVFERAPGKMCGATRTGGAGLGATLWTVRGLKGSRIGRPGSLMPGRFRAEGCANGAICARAGKTAVCDGLLRGKFSRPHHSLTEARGAILCRPVRARSGSCRIPTGQHR